MCRKNDTSKKRSLIDISKNESQASFKRQKEFASKLDEAPSLSRRIFSTHFCECYAYVRCQLESKETFGTNMRVVRHVGAIIRLGQGKPQMILRHKRCVSYAEAATEQLRQL